MRNLIILATLLAICSPAFSKDIDVNLYATGYDYLFNYSDHQKTLLISAIFQYLEVQDEFKVDKGILVLDGFYAALYKKNLADEEDEYFLSKPCLGIMKDAIEYSPKFKEE